MTTTELIDQALDALTPKTGFHKPHPDQVTEAHARGVIATASALDRIADALEALANPAPTVQDAVHHSH